MKKRKDLSVEYYDHKVQIYSDALEIIRGGGFILEGTPYYCGYYDHIECAEGVYYDLDKRCLESGTYFYNGGYGYPMTVSYDEERLLKEIEYYEEARSKSEKSSKILKIGRR